MDNRIRTAEELAIQASQNAQYYMEAAFQRIEATFGAGFAKAHPELIGAFMQTAATDFLAAVVQEHIAPELQNITEGLAKLR